MQICPKCRAFYATNSSGFCRGDGTPLIDLQPDSDEWQRGQHAIEKTNRAIRKKQRLTKIRRIVFMTMAMLLMTRVVYVVAVKSVVHTDDNRPKISAAQSESPDPAPDVSPSPSVSRSPGSPSRSTSTFFKITVEVKFLNVRRPEVLQIMLNGIAQTPATDAKGNYVFAALPAGGNYTITPVSPALNFEPSNQVVNGLSRDEQVSFSAFPRKETPTPTPVLHKIKKQKSDGPIRDTKPKPAEVAPRPGRRPG